MRPSGVRALAVRFLRRKAGLERDGFDPEALRIENVEERVGHRHNLARDDAHVGDDAVDGATSASGSRCDFSSSRRRASRPSRSMAMSSRLAGFATPVATRRFWRARRASRTAMRCARSPAV